MDFNRQLTQLILDNPDDEDIPYEFFKNGIDKFDRDLTIKGEPLIIFAYTLDWQIFCKRLAKILNTTDMQSYIYDLLLIVCKSEDYYDILFYKYQTSLKTLLDNEDIYVNTSIKREIKRCLRCSLFGDYKQYEECRNYGNTSMLNETFEQIIKSNKIYTINENYDDNSSHIICDQNNFHYYYIKDISITNDCGSCDGTTRTSIYYSVYDSLEELVKTEKLLFLSNKLENVGDYLVKSASFK
jgi:hypothetical protein